jgi:hypothetical protein
MGTWCGYGVHGSEHGHLQVGSGQQQCSMCQDRTVPFISFPSTNLPFRSLVSGCRGPSVPRINNKPHVFVRATDPD